MTTTQTPKRKVAEGKQSVTMTLLTVLVDAADKAARRRLMNRTAWVTEAMLEQLPADIRAEVEEAMLGMADALDD